MSHNHQRVSVRCGGFCGGCKPKGYPNNDVTFRMNQSLVVDMCDVRPVFIVSGEVSSVEALTDGLQGTCSQVKLTTVDMPVCVLDNKQVVFSIEPETVHHNEVYISVLYEGKSCLSDMIVFNTNSFVDSCVGGGSINTRCMSFMAHKCNVVKETQVVDNRQCTFHCQQFTHIILALSRNEKQVNICEIVILPFESV